MNIDEKNCKYCGESIKLTAIKCKHCGEFLNDEAQFKKELIKSESSIKTLVLFSVFGLVIVFFGLILTNPSKEDFKKFINEKISSKIDTEVSKNNFGSMTELISGFAKGVVNVALEDMVTHKDYFFFSTYSVDTALFKAMNQDVPDLKFLGVANSFIPLSKALYSEGNKENITVSTKDTKKLEPNEEILDTGPQSTFDKLMNSGSTLQKFINLDPLHKQKSLFENALNIKPIKVLSEVSEDKKYVYSIKGCEFSVITDKNDNVNSYELLISKNCPAFQIERGNLIFNSEKTSLRKIVGYIKKNPECFSYRFTVDYLVFMGNAIDPSDWNYLDLYGNRVCNNVELTFTFKNNNGIEQWKEQLTKAYGGFDIVNEIQDHRDKINIDKKYNALAEKLWSDNIPYKVQVR
jgi:hypothetical protein